MIFGNESEKSTLLEIDPTRVIVLMFLQYILCCLQMMLTAVVISTTGSQTAVLSTHFLQVCQGIRKRFIELF